MTLQIRNRCIKNTKSLTKTSNNVKKEKRAKYIIHFIQRSVCFLRQNQNYFKCKVSERISALLITIHLPGFVNLYIIVTFSPFSKNMFFKLNISPQNWK